MDSKEYVNLLEAAVSTHPNAPCEKIVNWKGNGDLPTDEDLNDLVDKITKDEKDTNAAVQEDTKEVSKDDSPLSILENELDKVDEDTNKLEDDLLENVKFTEQESEIINRLITEMNAFDSGMGEDELMGEPYEEEPYEELGSEEDLDLGVPQEDYELEDLGI